MLKVQMLEAQEGDCLWIEYGSKSKTSRILIDGGTMAAGKVLRERIQSLDVSDRRFELLVVTHIDTDHIDGVLTLLQDPPDGLVFDEVWFNGYRHAAEGSSYLGPLQGEYLGVHLEKEEAAQGRRFWNRSFGGKAIVVPETGALPEREMEGGMRLTLLGPTRHAMQRLAHEWEKVLGELGMMPGSTEEAEDRLSEDSRYAYLGQRDVEEMANRPFEQDTAVANGSSIVLLAECEGQRILFGADAFPSEIAAGLRRFQDEGRVALAALKVPHHGSRKNNDRDLYRMLDCGRFLISTNGKKHHHPNQEAVARILTNKRDRATLYFNYCTGLTKAWDSDLKSTWNYTTCYGDPDGTLLIDL